MPKAVRSDGRTSSGDNLNFKNSRFICFRPFYGGICGRYFANERDRNEHILRHEDPKARASPECWCVSTSPQWLANHAKQKCPSFFGHPPRKDDLRSWCLAFGYHPQQEMTGQGILRPALTRPRHNRLSDSETNDSNRNVGQFYEREAKSESKSDSEKKTTPNNKKQFVCNTPFQGGICGRLFTTKRLRDEHVKTHDDERAKAVPNCWCVSTSPQWLSTHSRNGCQSTSGRVPSATTPLKPAARQTKKVNDNDKLIMHEDKDVKYYYTKTDDRAVVASNRNHQPITVLSQKSETTTIKRVAFTTRDEEHLITPIPTRHLKEQRIPLVAAKLN